MWEMLRHNYVFIYSAYSDDDDSGISDTNSKVQTSPAKFFHNPATDPQYHSNNYVIKVSIHLLVHSYDGQTTSVSSTHIQDLNGIEWTLPWTVIPGVDLVQTGIAYCNSSNHWCFVFQDPKSMALGIIHHSVYSELKNLTLDRDQPCHPGLALVAVSPFHYIIVISNATYT